MIKIEITRATLQGYYYNLNSEDIEELLITSNVIEDTVMEYEFEDEQDKEATECFNKLIKACRGFKGSENISIQYLTMYKETTNKEGMAFRETIKNYIPDSIV